MKISFEKRHRCCSVTNSCVTDFSVDSPQWFEGFPLAAETAPSATRTGILQEPRQVLVVIVCVIVLVVAVVVCVVVVAVLAVVVVVLVVVFLLYMYKLMA